MCNNTTPVKTHLAPCPFCGGTPTLTYVGNDAEWVVACCVTLAEATEAEAVCTWNTRRAPLRSADPHTLGWEYIANRFYVVHNRQGADGALSHWRAMNQPYSRNYPVAQDLNKHEYPCVMSISLGTGRTRMLAVSLDKLAPYIAAHAAGGK